MSKATTARALRSGRLHPLYPAVFSVGHTALPEEGRLLAALLHCGPGAALSHLTAAWWWGLVPQPPPAIHVSTPAGTRSSSGILVHHPRNFDVVEHRGLAITTVARAIVDSTPSLSDLALRRALAEAEYRRLLGLADVGAELRRGRRGATRVRRALATHMPQLARTRNDLEAGFLLLCERHAIPIPEPNAPLLGYEIDALWRRELVAVELDGGDAHSSPARMKADRARDLRLRRAGYVVLRYTWDQVAREAGAVAADLRRALAASLIQPVPEGCRSG